MRNVLLAAGLSLALAAPALAAPAVTVTSAIMHRAPSVRSHIVQEIPANAQIDLQSCTGGWCYASWRDLFGYIPAETVAGDGPPPPVVRAPPVIVAPAFGWGGPYAGFGWGYGWRRW